MNNSDRLHTQAWQEFSFFCDSVETNQNQYIHEENFSDSPVFPLSQAQVGDIVRIIELQNLENIDHLVRMGFILGAELEIKSHIKSGSVIVALQDKSLGLGADTAIHILVSKTYSNPK